MHNELASMLLTTQFKDELNVNLKIIVVESI